MIGFTPLKPQFSSFAPVMGGLLSVLVLMGAVPPATNAAPTASTNVTQHHNNPSRDGLYIDGTFTNAYAAALTRDTAFDGTISGNVYAQPLYIEEGPAGPMVIAVTESNNVYALNASTGAIIWQRNLGSPAASLGNISPVGITSTPVVDLASRSLFVDAVNSGPNNFIYSLNVDTGATNAGWPVNVNTAVSGFNSSIQSQRAALAIMGSSVYVPYGGYFGDAGSYFGRVVGVQMSNPASVGFVGDHRAKVRYLGPGRHCERRHEFVRYYRQRRFGRLGRTGINRPPSSGTGLHWIDDRFLDTDQLVESRRQLMRILADPDRSWSTCREPRPPPWSSHLVKTATSIW